MASPSRLFLPPSSAATGISPTADASWDNTASLARVIPSLTKTNTAFATQSNSGGLASTTDLDVIYKQYVFLLPTGIAFATTQTVKGQVLAQENAAGNDVRSQCVIRVIASDGTTVRTTLLAQDTAALANEWSDTALVNRKIIRTGPANLTAMYTAVAGDYLVIEIGLRKHSNSTPGAGSTLMRFGDNNATDLPENETSTADNNTWIEFSGDLANPPGGLMNYSVWIG